MNVSEFVMRELVDGDFLAIFASFGAYVCWWFFGVFLVVG